MKQRKYRKCEKRAEKNKNEQKTENKISETNEKQE